MTVTSAVLYYGLIGLAVLVVLWPTLHTGRRFLVRWGVADPTEQQSVLAKRYLLERRLLYTPLLLLAPLVSQSFLNAGTFQIFLPLVLALLIAETIAGLRPVRGPRIATLHRRSWRDLVPKWAMALMFGIAALVVLISLLGWLAQPWLDRVADTFPVDGHRQLADGYISVSTDFLAELREPRWLVPIAVMLVGLACALGVVWLAVRRRSVADPAVDAALRMRSARVATGIGIAWMCAMLIPANNRLGFARSVRLHEPHSPPPPSWLEYTSVTEFLGFVALFVAAAGWIWAANPPRNLQKTAA